MKFYIFFLPSFFSPLPAQKHLSWTLWSSLCTLSLFLTLQPVLMEARGKYDFNATADDELSFRKGDILKVSVCWSDCFPAWPQNVVFPLYDALFLYFFCSDFKPSGWVVQSRDEWTRRIRTTKLHRHAVSEVRDGASLTYFGCHLV